MVADFQEAETLDLPGAIRTSWWVTVPHVQIWCSIKFDGRDATLSHQISYPVRRASHNFLQKVHTSLGCVLCTYVAVCQIIQMKTLFNKREQNLPTIDISIQYNYIRKKKKTMRGREDNATWSIDHNSGANRSSLLFAKRNQSPLFFTRITNSDSDNGGNRIPLYN